MRGGPHVIAAYALIALTVFPVFPHFVSPNEFTRWLLAASIVENGSIEVSALVPQLGSRFEDLSEIDGRLYSNKAPGLAFVSLPGYLLGRAGGGDLRSVITAMRLFGSTLPLILLAILFLRLTRERAPQVICILLFATPLFTYGLLLFSHAIVAASLFGAWAALHASDEKYPVAAGALIGLATICEYPAAIPGLVILLGLLGERPSRPQSPGGTPALLARVIAGGVPFAIGLAIYNRAAFGSPFTLSTYYDRLPEYRALGRSALFGVHFPSLEVLSRLLFDPGRGLLVFSPVLLLSIPAFIAARRVMKGGAFWTLLLAPLSIIIFYSGYPNWHGGWATGPRYIVTAIPFLVYAMSSRDGGIVEALLGGWSVAAVVLTSLVFPFVPEVFVMPWSSLSLPLLRDGLVAPSIFHFIWRPLAIGVPFGIVVAVMMLVFRGRRALAVIAGIVLAIVAGAFAPRTPMTTLQRAYIEEVYFERAGALEREFPNIAAAQPRLMQRRESERALPPDSWPF